MQARVDWVLIILGTQVIKKKQPVRPVFPDYLSVSYDYVLTINRYKSTNGVLQQIPKYFFLCQSTPTKQQVSSS